MQRFFTTGAAAKELERSLSTLRWYCDTGRLACVRVGAFRLIGREMKSLRARTSLKIEVIQKIAGTMKGLGCKEDLALPTPQVEFPDLI